MDAFIWVCPLEIRCTAVRRSSSSSTASLLAGLHLKCPHMRAVLLSLGTSSGQISRTGTRTATIRTDQRELSSPSPALLSSQATHLRVMRDAIRRSQHTRLVPVLLILVSHSAVLAPGAPPRLNVKQPSFCPPVYARALCYSRYSATALCEERVTVGGGLFVASSSPRSAHGPNVWPPRSFTHLPSNVGVGAIDLVVYNSFRRRSLRL